MSDTHSSTLSEFVSKFTSDPQGVRGAHDCPFLLWDPTARSQHELWLGTQVGASLRKLIGSSIGKLVPGTGREPLVFPVLKGSSKFNAFAMGVTVGRTENNDIAVNDDSMSRFHAFFQHKHEWRLTDADSKNGTYINGNKLTPQLAVAVPDLAVVQFGDVEMKFFFAQSFFDSLTDVDKG
jgi:hypothetical protein